jgi:hypothetical protein
MKKSYRELVENEKLNVKFKQLTVYGGKYDGTECDLRKAADILRTPMKKIAEGLETHRSVKINGFTVFWSPL